MHIFTSEAFYLLHSKEKPLLDDLAMVQQAT